MSYDLIAVEQKGRVGVITFNRPKQLNALNPQLMQELGAALQAFDANDGIGAIVITGSEKAFAAGADIGVMKDYSYMDAFKADYITRDWEHIRRIRKPVIAAVAGYALGGGNELAMMCDIVIAAENARFGQPEINLGIMPGAGGTQRLPRAVGKAKAIDLCGAPAGAARRVAHVECRGGNRVRHVLRGIYRHRFALDRPYRPRRRPQGLHGGQRSRRLGQCGLRFLGARLRKRRAFPGSAR